MTAFTRVAALYDIHGNLPALEAVLREVRRLKADAILVGGDVVPGPMPRETLDCLLGLDIPTRFIMGNGDREVGACMRGSELLAIPEPYREMMRWNAAQFEAAAGAKLESWPALERMEVAGVGEVLFCHATPRNDTEIFTRRTDEGRLLPLFCDVGAPLVVCGHTHMQFDRMVGLTRVVNAGSVGMPFGEPGAYWLLLGPTVELRHTPYDLANAAERIRDSGYPWAAEFAANSVLAPRSEEETLELFAKVEVQ